MSDDKKAVRPGVILEPPFVLPAEPEAMFARRAVRLRFLAESARLCPYLRFLAGIVETQAKLAGTATPPRSIPAEKIERARAGRMPPIDRMDLVASAELHDTLSLMLRLAAALDMPAEAEETRRALENADRDTRDALLAQVLAEEVALEDAGAALYAAAAVQVYASRLAATLDAARLVPVRVGLCPCCGGRPASSFIVADKLAEGARYAVCGTCCTRWNEVRIKCLACGSTKGIGYRSLGEDAVIKAEVCDECHSWVKILHGNRDTALEPIADDVASLGLDAMMRETEWRRAGFDPFLIGF